MYSGEELGSDNQLTNFDVMASVHQPLTSYAIQSKKQEPHGQEEVNNISTRNTHEKMLISKEEEDKRSGFYAKWRRHVCVVNPDTGVLKIKTQDTYTLRTWN